MKNFLNISDLSSKSLREIIEEAKVRKSKRLSLNKSAADIDQPFAGKSMIMIFEKPSTEQEFPLILQSSNLVAQLLF